MIHAPRVGILADSRRMPLYDVGLLNRLLRAFDRAGAITQVLNMAETPPSLRTTQADPFDALYPLPVVPSATLTDSVLFGTEPPWLVNPIRVQLRSLDKRLTLECLERQGLPYPETLQTSHPDAVLRFVRSHGRAIIKSPDNVAGLGHYVVEEEAGQLIASVPSLKRHRQLQSNGSDERPAGRRAPLELLGPPGPRPAPRDPRQLAVSAPYLVQRLVGAPDGGVRHQVYRFYVVGKKPLFGSARVLSKSPPEDLSYAIVNYAWGGEYQLFELGELPDEMTEVGEATAKALEIEAGAIDLIEDENGRWLVLEGETDNLVYHLCRGFRTAKEFGPTFDLDVLIARWVVERLRGQDPGVARDRADRTDVLALMRLLSGN